MFDSISRLDPPLLSISGAVRTTNSASDRLRRELTPGAIVDLEEGQRPWRFTMELVDQLLAILAGPNPSLASRQLIAAGHNEDEVRGAWNFARAAGFTQSTGLGADRLTPAGRARAEHIRSSGQSG